MGNEKETAIGHILKAVIYSWNGIKAAWTRELAFRIETVVIAVLLPIGIWICETAVERALLIGSSLLVLITELLNSAVEKVVDRIGSERHILSKHAKDLGSAAAAVSMLTAAVIWGLIIYERLFR
ncbi:MAG: diacylglycerol kinase [Deltaproteobacteria bacterium]|jgi:diacylglycerol kinase (ATP)|nr:diacylglycerol kinase [Deltaproteobacteria bacterium]